MPAGLARGYLPADNPVLPAPGPDPVDVSEVEPFGWGGGGMVSSARDVARFLQALLGGELLPPDMSAEMLSTVPSDWEESDGYGLGIEEVTSLWGIEQSTCGSAWGHFGFSLGYTTIALGSRNGDRQVVVMFNSHPLSEETWAVSRPPDVGLLLRLTDLGRPFLLWRQREDQEHIGRGRRSTTSFGSASRDTRAERSSREADARGVRGTARTRSPHGHLAEGAVMARSTAA